MHSLTYLRNKKEIFNLTIREDILFSYCLRQQGTVVQKSQFWPKNIEKP